MAQRVTWVAAIIEATPASTLDVTQVGLYVETEPISSDKARVTVVAAYAEVQIDSDQARVTQVTAYAEVTVSGVSNLVRVTETEAYAEVLVDTDVVRATEIVAYAEVEGTNLRTRITQAVAYAEVESTNLHARVTSVHAYVETNFTPEIQVSAVRAYLETIGQGVSVSQFGVYVEYQGEGLAVTKFMALAEFEYVEIEELGTYKAKTTGQRRAHVLLPDEISGYAFDPKWSWWSVVVPQESRNYIHNPSFENEDVSLLSSVGTLSDGRVNTETPGATSGAWCYLMETIPLANNDLVYGTINLTIGAWVYSLDVYSSWPGAELDLHFRDQSFPTTIRARKIFHLDQGWQRIEMAFSMSVNDGVEIVHRITSANVRSYNIYLDRLQLENSHYATTYFDGDMVASTDPHPHYTFSWVGQRQVSDSIRRGHTALGGRPINFTEDVGFLTTSIIGLGMAPFDIRTVKLDNGEEIHLDSFATTREFTIAGRIYGCAWNRLNEKRNELIKLVNPQNSRDREPLILIYQPTSASGEPYGLPLMIKCAYKEGLGGNLVTLYQENIGLQFSASEPYLFEEFTKHVNLSPYVELVGNAAVYRDTEHNYRNFVTDPTTGIGYNVEWLNGLPIVVGDFSVWQGLIYGSVAVWDGTDWQQVDPGDSGIDGIVYGIAVKDGDPFNYTADAPEIVLGGDFIETINHMLLNYVAGWKNGTFTSLGPGGGNTGLNGIVNVVKRGVDGTYYFGGKFTNNGGTTNADLLRIASLDGFTSAFGNLAGGLGPTGEVWDILVTDDGYVWVCGDFTKAYNGLGATSDIDVNGVARWNIQEQMWEALDTGFQFATVSQLLQTRNGVIYALGDFLRDGDNTYDLRGFVRWNGSSWEEAAPLRDWAIYAFEPRAAIDNNDVIWIYTDYVTGFVVPGIGRCWMFGWKDGVLYPPPYQWDMAYSPPGTEHGINRLSFGPNNQMVILFTKNDENVTVRMPSTVDIDYEGTAYTQPELIFFNEVTPSFIQNHTANAGIYVAPDARVAELEELRIKLDGGRHKIFTNARPNMIRHLMVGPSNMAAFRLLPNRTNIINVFAPLADFGGTPNPDSEIYMQWHNRYLSIDPGAAV